MKDALHICLTMLFLAVVGTANGSTLSAITFEEPVHHVGSPPTKGPPLGVGTIPFGHPVVVAGKLDGSSCELVARSGYDQITVGGANNVDSVQLEFDLLTENVGGGYGFAAVMDCVSDSFVVQWGKSGGVTAPVDDSRVHVVMKIDIANQRRTCIVKGVTIDDRPFAVSTVGIIRLGVGPPNSTSYPDRLEVRAYVDNIVVTSSTSHNPAAITEPATLIKDQSATLNGKVNPNGLATTAQFQYGLTASYGNTIGVTLSPADGATLQTVSAKITNLILGETYHFRVVAQNADGIAYGEDMTIPGEPLIFIPGIAGSELFSNGERLWPSISSSDIEKLNLRKGTSGVVATDIVRDAIVNTFLGELKVQEVYTPMLEHLSSHSYTEFQLNGDRTRLTSTYMLNQNYESKPSLFLFPYDWRQSYSSHMATLAQYIARIRQLHGGAKVNILAHSAGGLVIRRYILEHGTSDIDHVITVATPFWGSPLAIYRLLAGEFYPLATLNWITNSAIKSSLATFPGFHELLPSDYYLQNYSSSGAAVMLSESGWNINSNDTAIESYSALQYKQLMDQVSLPDTPSANNAAFHGYLEGRQDNWSADNEDVKYLHIYGRQMEPLTPVGIVAHETRSPYLHGTTEDYLFTPVRTLKLLAGEGDGVVPVLSSARLSQYIAPGAVTYPVTDTIEKADHTALMGHETVLSAIDAFLRDDMLPTQAGLASSPAPPSATQQISINGVGFVRIYDSFGNENTLLSDVAAHAIPGVTVKYGGAERWVDVTAKATADLTIQGTNLDSVLEIRIIKFSQDGTALSLRGYTLAAAEHGWRAQFSAGTDPLVSVDTNDDGQYDSGEQLTPTSSSGTGPVDASPPRLTLSLAQEGDAVIARLSSVDNVTADAAIRYTINDGPPRTYLTPLSFMKNGDRVVLKAFSEDAIGNASGLISTTVNPALSFERGDAGGMLSWPIADGYVLVESTTLVGLWSPSSVLVTEEDFKLWTLIDIGSFPRKFFRLRSQDITK